MTRCSRCHRQIKTPAVSSGGLTLGPRCAVIIGLAMPQPKRRVKRERAAVVLPGQLRLKFDEVAA